jgi:hypothetical protein
LLILILLLLLMQVVRADGIQVGTLLYKMARNRATSSPQSVPHWKVSMQDTGKIQHSGDDDDGEDISEHMLGRVLGSSTASLKGSSTTIAGTTAATAGSTSDGSTSSSPTPTTSIVSNGKGKKKSGKQKTVTIVAPPAPAPAPVVPAPAAKGGRRKKGSAPVKEKVVPAKGKKTVSKQTKKVAAVPAPAPATTASASSSKSKGSMTVTATSTTTKTSPRTGARAGTRSNAAYSSSDILTGIDDIGRIPLAAAALKKKQVQQSKKKEQRQLRHMAVGEETSTVNKFGETVVKVKLLTGTLYIYKGNAEGTAKRRAEFVRSK